MSHLSPSVSDPVPVAVRSVTTPAESFCFIFPPSENIVTVPLAGVGTAHEVVSTRLAGAHIRLIIFYPCTITRCELVAII